MNTNKLNLIQIFTGDWVLLSSAAGDNPARGGDGKKLLFRRGLKPLITREGATFPCYQVLRNRSFREPWRTVPTEPPRGTRSPEQAGVGGGCSAAGRVTKGKPARPQISGGVSLTTLSQLSSQGYLYLWRGRRPAWVIKGPCKSKSGNHPRIGIKP